MIYKCSQNQNINQHTVSNQLLNYVVLNALNPGSICILSRGGLAKKPQIVFIIQQILQCKKKLLIELFVQQFAQNVIDCDGSYFTVALTPSHLVVKAGPHWEQWEV